MTLIEMLIVLAIIGVAAGAVSLGIGAVTRAPNVETEARRLATQLQAAADDAMLGDHMIAFTVREDGYGFSDYSPGGLTERTGEAFGFHQLPGGIVMTLNVNPPVVLGVDGAGQPLLATIESGEQRWMVTFDGLTATAAPAPEPAT
ncbi:prepilin-type N-terminal cleavage/methylation domain-containing protein [Sphingosinithalassobacter tenebrarum]|uniref:Prepilin-type N-terminal cleavage/methylation domain-containing protein n=2 Tax=Stakelama tenebrarum TaxID=2711215 RepID=A0A6G6YA80_9SPHN|nr:prepilin-type N-terminal cleavage/methylation domain-containing protein [Sphingosinithalassobacter tenebrarum]